jgi:hypothetical protein
MCPCIASIITNDDQQDATISRHPRRPSPEIKLIQSWTENELYYLNVIHVRLLKYNYYTKNNKRADVRTKTYIFYTKFVRTPTRFDLP